MVGITGGLGFGLGKGIGAPQMRLFLGAVFTPDFRDADSDGVYDSEDRCPDQPEDSDGWKDNDGCPDPDNDGDGIPDASDKCPNEPEDLDRFEDEDGCPDPDNDKDGIPDVNDAVPERRRGRTGQGPNDGCPSTTEDSDGDGIPDATDKCPDEPEDSRRLPGRRRLPRSRQRQRRHPRRLRQLPERARGHRRLRGRGRLPRSRQRQGRHPRRRRQVPEQARDLERLQGRRRLPGQRARRSCACCDDTHRGDERIAFARVKGASELKESALVSVKLVGLVLKGHPEIAKLDIEVQSEKVGVEEAKHRAEVIREALVAQGVKKERLTASGKAAVGAGSKVVVHNRREGGAPAADAQRASPKGPPAIP